MNKEQRVLVLETIKENGWLIGDWTEDIWNRIITGIFDYRTKQIISGFCDAHCHLDRCYTFSPEYLPTSIDPSKIADLPLKAKQDLIGQLHDGRAYTSASLRKRMELHVQKLIRIGTREVWAAVDTTPDIGLRAFNEATRLKEKYAGQIDIKVSAYPIFGLKDPKTNPDRLNTLIEASKKADFILGLPEKDDTPSRVGFEQHVSILLDLAYKNKIEVQIHVDQENSGFQEDSFRTLNCIQSLLPEKFDWFTKSDTPKLWLVHVISPSCYDHVKFSKLLDLILKFNVGVIICPVAALSMRTLRSETSPIHNSIARVIEMMKAGVNIRIGTDNINDILVPSGDGLVLTEIKVLSNIVRNYSPHIFAKIASGIDLNDGDRHILAQALHESRKACEKHQSKIDAINNTQNTIEF